MCIPGSHIFITIAWCMHRWGLTASQTYRQACVVLPMGWSSSVGIMHQLSREVFLRHGLPSQWELRKTAPLPQWFSEVLLRSDEIKTWWQVYLDNFLSGEVAQGGEGQLNVELQTVAMQAWSQAGILTAEDKQVLNSPEVVELDVRVDGQRGLLGGSPARTLKNLCFKAQGGRRSWVKLCWADGCSSGSCIGKCWCWCVLHPCFNQTWELATMNRCRAPMPLGSVAPLPSQVASLGQGSRWHLPFQTSGYSRWDFQSSLFRCSTGLEARSEFTTCLVLRWRPHFNRHRSWNKQGSEKNSARNKQGSEKNSARYVGAPWHHSHHQAGCDWMGQLLPKGDRSSFACRVSMHSSFVCSCIYTAKLGWRRVQLVLDFTYVAWLGHWGLWQVLQS